jgi:hypothetical protein
MNGTQNRDMVYLRIDGDLKTRVALQTTEDPGAALWLNLQKGATENIYNQLNLYCKYSCVQNRTFQSSYISRYESQQSDPTIKSSKLYGDLSCDICSSETVKCGKCQGDLDVSVNESVSYKINGYERCKMGNIYWNIFIQFVSLGLHVTQWNNQKNKKSKN